MAESYFINRVMKLVKKLYLYAKYSYILSYGEKAIKYLKSILIHSKIYRLFTREDTITRAWENSFICRTIDKILGLILALVGKLISTLGELNKYSTNKRIYKEIIKPLKNEYYLFVAILCIAIGYLISNILFGVFLGNINPFSIRLLILLSIPIIILDIKSINSKEHSLLFKIGKWLIND